MEQFEWDELKNRENCMKHGISLEEAAGIFDGPVLTKADDRYHYGEVREVSFGLLGGVLVMCVAHTERDTRTRLISSRRATRKERRLFYDHLAKALG